MGMQVKTAQQLHKISDISNGIYMAPSRSFFRLNSDWASRLTRISVS